LPGRNMRTSLALRPTWSRVRLSSVFILLFGVALAYESSRYLLRDDYTALAYLGMVLLGGAIVVAILNSWRAGVYFFLAWLLFEDFARKFLGNNMAIYFAKDVLLLVVYLSFFAAYRRKDKDLQTFRPPFLLVLVVFGWFGLLQVFNPASTSFFYGLLGMKLYFYYMPLVLVGYALINSEAELRHFFYVNLGLMLVIATLGIVQSVAGPRFLSPAVLAEDIRLLGETYRVAPITGVTVYRPTSVFVSTGRFADMLIVAWMFVLGFSGYLLLRHRRGRLFAFLALSVAAAACVMCASRGLFMWSLGSALVSIIAFIWGAPWRQGEARRAIRIAQRTVLGVALALVVLVFLYPEPFVNRLAVYSETLDPRSPANEVLHRTRDYPLANFLGAFDYERWPYGYGIGTVSLGGQYVSRFFHVRPPIIGLESGFGCLVLELGIVGFILWLVMGKAVLFSAWKVVRGLKGSPWFPLAFMIFWYAFLLLLPLTYEGMQAYEDFVLNAYLWLSLGILFRLPKLALSSQFAAASTENLPRGWIR
jgi:hypothetical protein